jgi:DNA polymerase I-like protein with 3'-5' exonuclease and polymerase domains
VNVDYVAQEIGVAAALSGDPALRAVYESSDCHMEFAIRAGAAPAGATKKSHPHVRKPYKTVNLGAMYGQSAYGAAAALGIPHADAALLLEDHRRLFPVFWRWSDRMTQAAVDSRRIRTPCGWRAKVPPGSNERTWLNWPMQSVGGDIMRATVTYLDRQGVRILAPIHDGFLLSCRRKQLGDLRAAVDYACGAATEHSLPGFLLRWEVAAYDSRYEEADGRDMWGRLCEILRDVDDGQQPDEGPLGGRAGPLESDRRDLPAADHEGLDLEGLPGPRVHLLPLPQGGGAHERL